MRDAIKAATDFAAAQGAALLQLPITETFEAIEVTCPVADLAKALTLSSAIVREGGIVSLVLVRDEDDEELTISSDEIDQWTSDGMLDLFYPELARGERPDRWVTADFTKHGPSVGFRATATIKFDKARWTSPLSEETGRAVWVGLTEAAFVAWVRRGTWTGPLSRLFGKAGALVCLSDWIGDAVTLGDRLRIGNLENTAGAPPPDQPWPEQAPPEMGRVLGVQLADFRDGGMKTAIAGLVGAAAAWLLGEERGSTWSRPSRRSSTRWIIGADPAETMMTATAIVELARWVQREANATRLAIARQTGAVRIPSVSDAKDAERVLEVADIAYYTAIDESVQKALQTQLVLERSFQDLDGKLAELRSTLRDTVDQTIIRALTASLGIAIAALTVGEARGWPTVLAAEAVAAYVLFTAWWSLATMRGDFTSRLETLRDLIRARAVGLGNTLAVDVDRWKTALRKRLLVAQIVLTFIAAVVGAGGAVLGLTLGQHEETPGKHSGKTHATATPVTSRSSPWG